MSASRRGSSGAAGGWSAGPRHAPTGGRADRARPGPPSVRRRSRRGWARRWRTLSTSQQQALLHAHASTVFEDCCRAIVPGSQRYWNRDLALDVVAPDPADPEGLRVAEVKWRRLSVDERASVGRDLEARFARSALAPKYPRVRFEVMDASLLAAGLLPFAARFGQAN